MKKETLADKLAKKNFESESFQKSWRAHMVAFGPILAPAFQDDYQAKVHLTAALNKISLRDLKGGLDKLKGLQKYCQTNADNAAWCFFMGLCCEMAGATEQMVQMYQEADSYGHRFYMPYLKLGKQAYQYGAYDAAEENYLAGIRCFEATGLDAPSKVILGSAYANLGACLTMMHRYGEALSAFETSRQLRPSLPARDAAEAILAAATGREDLVDSLLAGVEAPVLAATRQVTEEILNRTHPHFHELDIDEAALDAFWAWFAAEEASLLADLKAEDYAAVITKLIHALEPLAPFQKRAPEMGLIPGEGKTRIILSDFYVVALWHTYDELLRRMPDNLKNTWIFEIRH